MNNNHPYIFWKICAGLAWLNLYLFYLQIIDGGNAFVGLFNGIVALWTLNNAFKIKMLIDFHNSIVTFCEEDVENVSNEQ